MFQKELNASRKKAFTLIELLVVITIIGFLASVVLVSMGGAKGKARDARRYSDLRQLQTALELYYDDNGSYPTTGGQWFTVCPSKGNSYCTYNKDVTGSNGWVPNISPTYIGTLPTDPSGCKTGGCGGYIYRSNGIDYKIAADWSAEVGEQCGTGKPFYDPRCTSTPCGYCSLWTSGAKNW